MATLKITTANTPIVHQEISLWAKYLNFIDGQSTNRTLWFFISLAIHATVFLPLPILLIGYFDAPIAILGITMACFFTNFVANMGGSGIRVTLSCFLVSTLIHIAMTVLVLAL